MAKGNSKKKEESSDEEEFEVEKILQHKGKAGNRMYLVAWVGYPASENSWTEEENLDSCKALLDLYWKDRVAGNSAPSSKKAADTSSARPAAAGPSKKRKSIPNGGTSNRNQPARKRTKEESSDGSQDRKAPAAASGDPASDSGEDGMDGGVDGDIVKYMDLQSWEDCVNQVITVEKDEPSNSLRLFVTWEDGSRAWVASELIYTRAPQKVIAFFEAHLKFKSISGN